MRVSGSSLNLGVAEQLADHREALAQGQRSRSIRVPKIVSRVFRRSGFGVGFVSLAAEIVPSRPILSRKTSPEAGTRPVSAVMFA